MNLLAISLETIKSLPLPAITLGVFIVIFLLYVYIAKAIINKQNAKFEAKEKADSEPTAASTPAKAAVSAVAGTSAGNLELVDTDEKTAAVIMAIVSNQSGIPLERLQFKSITLMED